MFDNSMLFEMSLPRPAFQSNALRLNDLKFSVTAGRAIKAQAGLLLVPFGAAMGKTCLQIQSCGSGIAHNIQLSMSVLRSNSAHDIMKFNGNSKQFALNWNFQENAFKCEQRFKRQEIKEVGPATRTDRFLEKKPHDMAPKIGAKGTEPPQLPVQSPRITRNEREKTNWGLSDRVPEPLKAPVVQRTQKDMEKLSKEFDELKTAEKKQRKDDQDRRNEQKIEKLTKKLKERQPFRL